MPDLLTVDGVDVRYRMSSRLGARLRGRPAHVDAVLGATFRLPAGETFGLVGESGSGKTSLARALVGLTPVHAGQVVFRGTDLSKLDRQGWSRQRRDLAMMFQDPVASLSPRKTVRFLLEEPGRIHGPPAGDRERQAEALLETVGLDGRFLDRYPHQLSGGQARRVGVARALSLSPALIICDEPTAGLDVSVQGEILNLLRDLQRERRLSYLIVTHNLPVIRNVSHWLGIMYLGRLVEQGPTAEVFARPSHPYTKGLMDAVPRPGALRRQDTPALSGEVPSLLRRPPGCEFHARCPSARPRCRSEAPVYTALSPDRGVACHYPL